MDDKFKPDFHAKEMGTSDKYEMRSIEKLEKTIKEVRENKHEFFSIIVIKKGTHAHTICTGTMRSVVQCMIFHFGPKPVA